MQENKKSRIYLILFLVSVVFAFIFGLTFGILLLYLGSSFKEPNVVIFFALFILYAILATIFFWIGRNSGYVKIIDIHHFNDGRFIITTKEGKNIIIDVKHFYEDDELYGISNKKGLWFLFMKNEINEHQTHIMEEIKRTRKK